MPDHLNVESAAVHCYLNILQGIIARMAANSSNCKTMCVTLVSAIIVVIVEKAKTNYVWISIFPTILFFLLDSYYLGQERSFRGVYDDFIKRIHSGSANGDDLFIILPIKETNVIKVTIDAAASFVIYPFYLTLLGLLIIGHFFIF